MMISPEDNALALARMYGPYRLDRDDAAEWLRLRFVVCHGLNIKPVVYQKPGENEPLSITK